MTDRDKLRAKDLTSFSARLARFLFHDELSKKLGRSATKILVRPLVWTSFQGLRLWRRTPHAQRIGRDIIDRFSENIQAPLGAHWDLMDDEDSSLVGLAQAATSRRPILDLYPWVFELSRDSAAFASNQYFSKVATGLAMPADSRNQILLDGSLHNLLTESVESALNHEYCVISAARHRGPLTLNKAPTFGKALRRVLSEDANTPWDPRLLPIRNALSHSGASYTVDEDRWEFRDLSETVKLSTEELYELIATAHARARSVHWLAWRFQSELFNQALGERTAALIRLGGEAFFGLREGAVPELIVAIEELTALFPGSASVQDDET